MFSATAFHDTEAIKEGLQGPFIVIENALDTSKAEEIYRNLTDFNQWDIEDESSFEGKTSGGYSYNRFSIDLANNAVPSIFRELNEYLNSEEVLQLVENLSNRRCDQFVGKAVAYKDGHHIKSHNDLYAEKAGEQIITRSVTFNYFLTKDWDPDWGGQLVWESPHTTINPSFNTLVLFLVGPDSHHHVTPIKGCGSITRYAITGWFITHRNKEQNKLKLDFIQSA